MSKPTKPGPLTTTRSSLPAAQVMSFLREAHSLLTWTEHDFAASMNVTKDEVKDALGMLQLAGYAEPVEKGKWRTTDQGRQIGGGNTPRFTTERVERALNEVKERIDNLNSDETTSYRVSRAVAFGDFLLDRARVQAAEVGVELEPRISNGPSRKESAASRAEQSTLLKRLKSNSALLHVQPYESWMGSRSHRRLK